MDDTRCRQFFLEPAETYHRPYEALCAFFVEGRQRQEIAQQFGYQESSLRVRVSQFRNPVKVNAWVSEGWAYAKQILMFPQGVREVGTERCVPTLRRSRGGSPRRNFSISRGKLENSKMWFLIFQYVAVWSL
jgi:hypothetical protein